MRQDPYLLFALRCAANALESGVGTEAVLDWLDRHGARAGLPEDAVPPRRRGRPLRPSVLAALARRLRAQGGPAEPPPVFARVAELADALGFDALDRRLLELALALGRSTAARDLLAARSGCEVDPEDTVAFIAALLDAASDAVADRLAEGAPLVASGVLVVDFYDAAYGRPLDVPSRLARALRARRPGVAAVLEGLFGRVPTTDLDWADMVHLSVEAELAVAILRGALERRAPGVHVLLYGPPGTGKSSLAVLLAERVGASLVAVGEADEDGDEPSRWERLAALKLGQRLLADRGRALLLFDEMEDAVSQGGVLGLRRTRGEGSRAFLHRLLESTPVPMIWTCNDVDGFDGALLRRMSIAIGMRVPPAAARARILCRQADRAGLAIDAGTALRLAHDHPSAPGLAAAGVRAAQLAGGGSETISRVVGGLARIVDGRAASPVADGAGFDPALAVADRDLAALVERLATAEDRAVSLCLYGPPGTGKSAFARHVAGRLGLEVVQKRASDLLGPFVGMTERLIADAFAEARDSGAMLVFDEADSLLRDRREAGQGWEVSQVNEMLTWMESHPLPFACTTNLFEGLDPASLRRFTLKLRFGCLGPPQIAAAWRRFYGRPAPPQALQLEGLTPGDFALVRRQAAVLGELDDDAALLDLLAREAAAKPGAGRKIGFAGGAVP